MSKRATTTFTIDSWEAHPYGELVGLHGEVRIDIAPDGTHTLILDYDVDDA